MASTPNLLGLLSVLIHGTICYVFIIVDWQAFRFHWQLACLQSRTSHEKVTFLFSWYFAEYLGNSIIQTLLFLSLGHLTFPAALLITITSAIRGCLCFPPRLAPCQDRVYLFRMSFHFSLFGGHRRVPYVRCVIRACWLSHPTPGSLLLLTALLSYQSLQFLAKKLLSNFPRSRLLPMKIYELYIPR